MRRTGFPVPVALLAVLAALAVPASGLAQFRRVVVAPTVVQPVIGPRFFPYAHVNYDPGSYLRGVASVIDAQGRYLRNTQEAFLLREQVRAAQLANRNRVFEQHLYERANTPTLEEQREFRRQQEFWRSWNDPPLTEIWSGRSLNDLLRALQMGRSEQDYRGATVPLDPELVRNINVASGTTSGSIGVFRQGDDIPWPLPLQREAFDKERQEIDGLAPKVVKQVAAGKVDANALTSLNQAISALRARLRDDVRAMSSTDYMQALRFVNQLRDSARALQDPMAANFFSAWTLTAQNVGELVDQMTQKGLRFGPAPLGTETHYTALQRALVAYAAGLPRESLRELRARFYSIDSTRPERKD
jgi:hypothetical protein